MSTVHGWQRHIKDLFTYKNCKRIEFRRSLLNWTIQSHGAEILRSALIDLTDENFEVCALVHDAVLLQIPIADFNSRLTQAKKIMVDASIKVVGGPIRVDQEIIRSNYKQFKKDGSDTKDQKLFDEIMKEINAYTRTELEVHPH